jgi:hypothetical protein
MSSTSQAILRTIASSLKASIGEVGVLRRDGKTYWRVTATLPSGERWTAESVNYDEAVSLLAAELGFAE